MRSTSLEDGQTRFGKAYRSHAYLLLKHATSALHPCVDQGHEVENQMTFHRALLLEAEASILAITDRDAPEAGLDALPYWDFATDIAQTGDWWSGSLWKYWGSPFGDPDNEFCIHDPVFETKVERGRVPELQKLISEIYEDNNFVMGNGYGFWRSPWNQAQCPGLTRNPGWVLGAPTDLGEHFRSCQATGNYTAFMICMQGRGFTRFGPDIGPHNAPHVSMGTFDDGQVGADVFIVMLTILSLGILSSNCMFTACMSKFRAEVKGEECTSPGKLVWLLTILTSLAIIGCLVAPAMHAAIIGISGASLHVRWLYETYKRRSIDFRGVEWRNGNLTCPSSGLCTENNSDDFTCECTTGHYTCGFKGADYWDGAFSLNENFFYSTHAFTDLMHLQWVTSHPGTDLYAGFPPIGQCPGLALDDDISEEFCFSASDIGIDELLASGEGKTPFNALHSQETCLTHLDILNLQVPTHSNLSLSEKPTLPYTYDVLAFDAVWRPVEPTEKCTLDFACGGTRSDQGLTDDERFIGGFVCVPSKEIIRDVGMSETSVNPHVQGEAISSGVCSEPRPSDAPSRECSCDAEKFRSRNLEFREETQRKVPQLVALPVGTGIASTGIVAVLILVIFIARVAHVEGAKFNILRLA
eukprot:CAMPEP_0171586738 /NCGR_PEP_ID=MMETSP0961-20121227/12782_1 /TAXON_ID=87120 /ORGANISM="Aurantiochytrium limacinum, Strain ATCCMYA-1381" /LENGTH=639 /DNA_ID=CAMNT_0012144603 /DNA_START=1 /DNA_END=1918 /DNA_ORIENTATION=-